MDYVDFCGVLHGLQIAEYSPFNASHLLYVIIHSINFKFKHITSSDKYGFVASNDFYFSSNDTYIPSFILE